MNAYQGSVAIITGASGALGGAVAERFYRAGVSLALLDKAYSKLQRRWKGRGSVLCLECDLGDFTQLEKSVGLVIERFGKVDSLLNIAGGFAMGHSVLETTGEAWAAMQEINVGSVFFACRAVLPYMRERKHGSVVNVGAKAALEGKALLAPYIVSKSSVMRLTECLAEENRRDGIRVNCILPSVIDTPANRRDMPEADTSSWVSPEAIADVFLFLVSDASRAINGASIPVYG
ncbi:3-oxoacyl-ACP reductase [Prosthecochloris sp. GSB1]|uniref:SDR family NAD(P)-dependent oxidoreductase n=1 Tax=Prosthecochloris sp. GSB1 TaxID=281093 RepID=UPI000B8CC3C7|nr:SDR family NAD(P)-dependent oxidoreductase [Prosthecochloris sp. GSB1]ASQ91783.1 3-oxoacyl-ACP reductase [Prosthecochloris sp. GSB1]